MSKLFRQLRGLSYADKFLFSGVILLVPIVKIALLLFGYKKVISFFEKRTNSNFSKNENPSDELKRHEYLMNLISKVLSVDGLCLPISIIFWWLLKRKNIKTDIHFGMKKENNKLFAHAWLEFEQMPLTSDSEIREKYTSFNEPIPSKFSG